MRGTEAVVSQSVSLLRVFVFSFFRWNLWASGSESDYPTMWTRVDPKAETARPENFISGLCLGIHTPHSLDRTTPELAPKKLAHIMGPSETRAQNTSPRWRRRSLGWDGGRGMGELKGTWGLEIGLHLELSCTYGLCTSLDFRSSGLLVV